MDKRCTRAAALAAAMAMVVSGTACGTKSEEAWDAERDNSVWTQHVADAGAPLTADEFKTTTWRAGNGDMVMFHDTSEAWPHMEMPTVRSADDHHSTLIPESVKDQSELLQFEFLQYADVKLDGAYYAVSTYFPDDPANMSTSAWSKGADGDLFVLAVNDKLYIGCAISCGSRRYSVAFPSPVLMSTYSRVRMPLLALASCTSPSNSTS